MASALETLVRILKLEREQGYRNAAVQGGISAYLTIWRDQARSQARKPEHFGLIAEIFDTLHAYDSIESHEERGKLVGYVLDRAQQRRPMPEAYSTRMDEFRSDFALYQQQHGQQAAAEPASASSRTAEAPAREQTNSKPRSEENSQSPGETGKQRDKRDKKSRSTDPAAVKNSGTSAGNPAAEAAKPAQPAKAAKAEKKALKRGQRRAGEPPVQGKSAPQTKERDGINVSERDESSSLDWEFRSSPVAMRLDIPPVPVLTRPPRLPRPAVSPEEAEEVLRGLHRPITTIKGVGDKLSEQFERLDVRTVYDLLTFFPRRYDDYRAMRPICRLQPGTPTSVLCTVQRTELRTRAGGRRDFYMEVSDGTARLDVVFFGAFYLQRQIQPGMQLLLWGTPSVYRDRLQMTHPEWEVVDLEDLKSVGIVPVYRLTEGLTARTVRRLMKRTVDYWSEHLPDYVPEATLERADLADLGWTIKNLHFPESQQHLELARRRWVFDELLLLQLSILGARRVRQSVPAPPLMVEDERLQQFIASAFPFPLTGAQQRAIADIRADAARTVPMNRLLQGDVGSGKTAVALTALMLAFMNNRQSALMAPTSILAEQHYRSISRTLSQFPEARKPNVALLTGALSESERAAVYAGLADGSIDIVIGTHALIQSNLDYRDLALVIIDEQHRFGVEQRGMLRGKGANPHLLVMTATPIPRTLALTLYADLDLSVLDEMPPGRLPVQTRIVFPIGRERVYEIIEAEVKLGHQAFIVYPLVEASETSEAESAVEAYEKLKSIFMRCRVGLLHGRMKPAEKDAIMLAFRNQEYDILVTTSVAEVGVDIPNATVILIEGANRFGLSQLHQFRGRVGRSGLQSYCFLLPDTDSPDALARLRAVEATNDGFKLAEVDWKLRGAGDLIGTRQSGSSKLQLLEAMSEDIVTIAQQEARTIYEVDPELSADEHRLLRQRVRLLADERSDLS